MIEAYPMNLKLLDGSTERSPLIDSWQLDGSVAAYQFALAKMKELVTTIGLERLLDQVNYRAAPGLAVDVDVSEALLRQSGQKPTHYKHCLAAANSNLHPNAGHEGTNITTGYKLFLNAYGRYRQRRPILPIEPIYGERLHVHSQALICLMLDTAGEIGYTAREHRFGSQQHLPEPVTGNLSLQEWTQVAADLGESTVRQYRPGDVIGLHPDEVHAVSTKQAAHDRTLSLVLELPAIRDESVVFRTVNPSSVRRILRRSTDQEEFGLVAAEIIPTRHQQRVYGVYPGDQTPAEMARLFVDYLGG
jgi:hypothetical protein